MGHCARSGVHLAVAPWPCAGRFDKRHACRLGGGCSATPAPATDGSCSSSADATAGGARPASSVTSWIGAWLLGSAVASWSLQPRRQRTSRVPWQPFYAQPSTYLFYDEDGVAHDITQAEGDKQDDPPMPALHALAQHPVFARRTRRRASAGIFMRSLTTST